LEANGDTPLADEKRLQRTIEQLCDSQPDDQRLRDQIEGFARDELLATGRVALKSCTAEETTKTSRLKTPEGRTTRQIICRDWRIVRKAADVEPVEIVVNNDCNADQQRGRD
jgi:hypothetical protein